MSRVPRTEQGQGVQPQIPRPRLSSFRRAKEFSVSALRGRDRGPKMIGSVLSGNSLPGEDSPTQRHCAASGGHTGGTGYPP